MCTNTHRLRIHGNKVTISDARWRAFGWKLFYGYNFSIDLKVFKIESWK